MQKESWDLFLACNSTLHDAGHRLWNTVNVRDPLSEAEAVDMNDSVRQVYAACDEAVGALADAVDQDTIILVFSLHGMDVNNSRNWIFPEMLRRILGDRPSRAGLLKRLRHQIPVAWRHAVKSRLPHHVRRGLTRFWAMKDYDWTSTRAFAPMSDMQAWVRINLKGREAGGIVEPGPAYDALCAEISAGVKTFVDADSGEPIVKDVVPTSRVFHGERLADLPDLIVRWVESPANVHRAISSPRYGVIPWPTPGHNPEGRSGNHRAQGMLIAAGPGIKAGVIHNADIYDIAPTILNLLDQPIPSNMEGRALKLLD
jgi:predicted AlkP superfamily phosphohydrolase/phosphomutase